MNDKNDKNYCIYEIFLPSFNKSKYIDNISYKKAKEIGKKLDNIKGKHYLIDKMDYIEKRSKEQLMRYVSYDETEICKDCEEYDNMGQGWYGINPCGLCKSWNICKAKNKHKSQAM